MGSVNGAQQEKPSKQISQHSTEMTDSVLNEYPVYYLLI